MPRVSNGTLLRRSDTGNWMIKFYVDGKIRQESAGTDDREAALAYLQRRVREARNGRLLLPSDRITFEEMHRLLLENHRFKRNLTDPTRHVKRLGEVFGGMHGEDISEERIVEYSKKRLERDGMTPATLRKELAILKRMLRLASAVHLE